ncbi:MAG: hypothetical protein U5L96_01710 [Owenweeksia sp.]|nr:hypothetical protein [Owenweeksia sp.]
MLHLTIWSSSKNSGLNGNRDEVISALRLHPKEVAERSQGDYLHKAAKMLKSALTSYQDGKMEEARNFALSAYLEGVEPIEVQLRANDAGFVADLENQLARMRSAIEKRKRYP